MKINHCRLAITAMLLCHACYSFAEDGARVGDLPGFGEDAYFADQTNFTGEQREATDEPRYDDPPGSIARAATRSVPTRRTKKNQRRRVEYAPIGFSALQPVAYQDGEVHSHYVGDQPFVPDCDGCDVGCDGCCDTGYGASFSLLGQCRLGRVIDCNTWMTAEALLWFPQARTLPVLAAAAPAGQLPILDPGGVASSSVTNLFGGEIESGVSGGFRIDYGRWVEENVGIGGRFWILGDNGDSFAANDAQGDQFTLGIPFFDTNLLPPDTVGENAVLIGFDDGINPIIAGNLSIESSLEMLGAEAYGRVRFGCASNHQIDLIGGYSYFQIDDMLRLSADNLADGTQRTFDDSFDAENRFHGGQLGLEISTCRGPWMLRSLTKVHLGNMQQTYEIAGSSTSTIIGGGPTDQFDGGIFAQPQTGQTGNIGTHSRDVFAFAPEWNVKLAYRFRPNVLLSVGYSFLYFDNVALNGTAIDRVLNGQNLASGVSAAESGFAFDDSSLWVQGIDLGAVIEF